MTDELRSIMYEAVSDITDPEESVLRTDLTLGRQALARQQSRRVSRRLLIPVGIAAAAAGVFGISVLANNPGSGVSPRTGTSAVAKSDSPRIGLIAYAGKQPDGFTIDQVPKGWEIQTNGRDVLIAPVGFANQDANEADGKIFISVANKMELAEDNRLGKGPLRVGNVTATRFLFPGSNPGLLLPAGKHTILIQFPDGYDWDDATIATFASGVHLTDTGTSDLDFRSVG